MQAPRERTSTVLAAVMRLLLTLLPLLSVPTEAAAAAFDGGAASGACEPIRITMCYSMPWNMTGLPNHLHQSSQHNAILSIDQYQPLADIGCSPLLAFYLCAMYAPICLTGGGSDAPVPPCRRVCESVRSACEPVVRRHGRVWPEAFACDGLPTYEEGVCISPEAIAPLPVAPAATSSFSPSLITPSSASPAAASSEEGRGGARLRDNMVDKAANSSRDAERICAGGLKFKKSTYLNKSYDYVIRVKYDGQREAGRGGGPRAANARGVEVDVVRVLRKTSRLRSGLRIGAAVVLWMPSPTGGGGGCSPLRRGNEYLVACYADPSDGRLLFDPQRCMLARWKDGWTRTVREWNRLADEALKPAERRPMSNPPPAPSTTQIADQLH